MQRLGQWGPPNPGRGDGNLSCFARFGRRGEVDMGEANEPIPARSEKIPQTIKGVSPSGLNESPQSYAQGRRTDWQNYNRPGVGRDRNHSCDKQRFRARQRMG